MASTSYNANSHNHADSHRALSFGTQAKMYDDARPPYPRELVSWALADLDTVPRLNTVPRLDTELGIIPETKPALRPRPRVLDLAAGTGKLTRAIAPHAGQIVAVEPDPEMRRQFAASTPGIEVLDGKDSAIPLPDNSMDAVFVGQAWHWFDEQAASAEVLRVLRPGGVLMTAWNSKDDSIEWVSTFCELIKTGSVTSDPRPAPHISWATPETKDFSWTWHRSVDQLIAYAHSTSWIISLAPQERDRLIAEVASHLKAIPGANAGLELPYVTPATRFRAPKEK